MSWSPFKNSPIAGKVRVAHRLPGRLRLVVPVMARRKNGYQEYAPKIEKLLNQLPGVHKVSVNQLTTSVLLLYEVSVVSDILVMNWIEQLAIAGIRRYKASKPRTNIHAKLLQVQTLLENEVELIKASHAATIQNRTTA